MNNDNDDDALLIEDATREDGAPSPLWMKYMSGVKKRTCYCETRYRKWNISTRKCESCGLSYEDERS